MIYTSHLLEDTQMQEVVRECATGIESIEFQLLKIWIVWKKKSAVIENDSGEWDGRICPFTVRFWI